MPETQLIELRQHLNPLMVVLVIGAGVPFLFAILYSLLKHLDTLTRKRGRA
jgi:hypothetical protein